MRGLRWPPLALPGLTCLPPPAPCWASQGEKLHLTRARGLGAKVCGAAGVCPASREAPFAVNTQSHLTESAPGVPGNHAREGAPSLAPGNSPPGLQVCPLD